MGRPAKRQTVTNADKTITPSKAAHRTDYKVDIDGKIHPRRFRDDLTEAESGRRGVSGRAARAVIHRCSASSDAQRQATKDAGKIAGPWK